jgi:prefoldin subunit 5
MEQNLRLSFSYVKKDLLKINEQIESLNEKIQHIALNHASLLGELSRIDQTLKGLKVKKSAKRAKKKAKKRAIKPKNAKKVVKETITYS